MNNNPIGIFDSGIGGLTVAHAIKQNLPNENIVYFGDSAHMPYGDKSAESIISYSKRIADFLLSKNCKIIIIACNSASAVAYEELKKYVPEEIEVINVIDPVIEYIKDSYKSGNIGIIGTKATISSEAYHKKISDVLKNDDLKIFSKATPLLVPMIEEGFIYDDISNAIIRAYLDNEDFKNISYLVLGCTHYPVIKNQIKKFYDFQTQVVDSTIITSYVRKRLDERDLFNENGNVSQLFYVSDYTQYFLKIAKLFFEEEIKLEKLNIWD